MRSAVPLLLLLGACTRIYYAPPLLSDGRGAAVDRFDHQLAFSPSAHGGRAGHNSLHGGGTFGLTRRLSLEVHGHYTATRFDEATVGGVGFLHRSRIVTPTRPFDLAWGAGGAFGVVDSDQPTSIGGGWTRVGIATTHRVVRPFGDVHLEHARDTRAAEATRLGFAAGLDIGAHRVAIRPWIGAQVFHGDAQIGSSCPPPPSTCDSAPTWERWTTGSWSLGLSLQIALPGGDRRLPDSNSQRTRGAATPVVHDAVTAAMQTPTQQRALGLLFDRYAAEGVDIEGPGAVDDARAIAELLQAGASVDAILALLQRTDVPGGVRSYARRATVNADGSLPPATDALKLAESLYGRRGWLRIGPAFEADVATIERALSAGRTPAEIRAAGRRVRAVGTLAVP